MPYYQHIIFRPHFGAVASLKFVVVVVENMPQNGVQSLWSPDTLVPGQFGPCTELLCRIQAGGICLELW